MNNLENQSEWGKQLEKLCCRLEILYLDWKTHNTSGNIKDRQIYRRRRHMRVLRLAELNIKNG